MRLLLLVYIAVACLAFVDGEAGDRVRERIDSVVEKEKQRALDEALEAEFELADKDEDGVVSKEEFKHYLVREDQFSLKDVAKGSGEWLGKRRGRRKQQEKQEEADGQTLEPIPTQPGLLDPTANEGGKAGPVADGSAGFWSALANSVLMIIVTELGDKTFFLAALMAMKNPRLTVFGGAIGALIIMTILSAGIGSALPALLPRKYTHFGAALLFAFFGIKMLQEARELYISPPSKNEELEEAEEEINNMTKKTESDGDGLERGSPSSGRSRGSGTNGKAKYEQNMKILMQAFMMTFLAEWGDRSQIATIALASAKNPFGVTIGGCIGHALCTGLAVVGGRLLATRISEKQVTLAGGILFCLFAVHSFLVGPE